MKTITHHLFNTTPATTSISVSNSRVLNLFSLHRYTGISGIETGSPDEFIIFVVLFRRPTPRPTVGRATTVDLIVDYLR